ncbi:MAG: hypothetical protein WA734_12190 [Candidatus Acidiferrales bacterium]
MLERLKRAIVESYVGAIALGWLLAEVITHFVEIFTAPVRGWVSERTYRIVAQTTVGPIGFPFRDALPELLRAFLLLVIWYALMRWLYFKPRNMSSSKSASDAELPS